MRERQDDGSVWHDGEIAIQKQAGVLLEARRLQDAIHSSIPDPFRMFIAAQRFAVLGTADGEGKLWASLWTGEPGFMHCPDRFSLHIARQGHTNQSAVENISANPDVGMIVIDFANRRRIRLNGEAELLPGGDVRIHAKQIYSNCPRYIQARTFESQPLPSKAASGVASTGSRLSAEQQRLIQNADTFFIASAHPQYGIDVSHRGGNPGFVHLGGDARLMFPDYNGNKMFNTLGNIHANPQVGLLFCDFRQGRTLQLSGRATIDWDARTSAKFPGAERVIVFEIDAVAEDTSVPLPRYRFQSYSPHNPA